MDTLTHYRDVIKSVLSDYASIPYAYDDVERQTVYDDAQGHYLIMLVGWEKDETRRVHGALVHIDIVDGKIWIQRDGTEDGIALDLVAAGIPKDEIILAFRPAEIRPFTGFAVA